MSRRLWRLEVICLLSVSLLQAPATPAPTCEDDGVQLLHMRQAQAADLNNSHVGAGEDSSLHVDTMKASTSSTAGALPPHTNMTEAQIHPSLLQTWRAKLSASYNSAYRDGYGVLTIVAITLFACLTSCCAIVSTRAFLVNESCDARRADSVLGMHERRHRLLQSLQSLRPSAAPPHPPHLKPKTNYKPWRQLVIDSPLEGDRLGVNLTEDTLVITSFADPRAETFGFKVGDRIVHINGVPVFKQLDFLQVLSGAMRDFHRSKQPIVVTTVDPTSDPTGPPSSATSKDAPRGLELQDEALTSLLPVVCGRWQLSSGENFIISALAAVRSKSKSKLQAAVKQRVAERKSTIASSDKLPPSKPPNYNAKRFGACTIALGASEESISRVHLSISIHPLHDGRVNGVKGLTKSRHTTLKSTFASRTFDAINTTTLPTRALGWRAFCSIFVAGVCDIAAAKEALWGGYQMRNSFPLMQNGRSQRLRWVRSEAAEQVAAIEKQKAEAEQEAAQQRKEAESAHQALEELTMQMKKDESNSGSLVATLNERDNKLAIAHAEIATLRERLEHAQAGLTRSQEESQSAQAAAQQAQTMYHQAMSKVDINAEAEKNRADRAEESVSKLSKELEELKAKAATSQQQLETERQKAGELEASEKELRSCLEESKAAATAADTASKQLEKDLGSANAELTEIKATLTAAQEEVAQKAAQLAQASSDLDSTKKALTESEEENAKLKQDLSTMEQDMAQHKQSAEDHSKRAQDAESALEDHKQQLDQAKTGAKDAEQAFESVRQQAAAEIAEHKKAIEDLHATCTTQEATLATKELEVESEKSRADLAESIAKSRQNEVEAAQQLTEKSKASLQSVRQELTAECSAAKAQVEVERRLALEAEENAEKFRLEAQAARNAEQAARIAEQEAKAALKLVKTGGQDAAMDELRKALAAKAQEAEEAKTELARLRSLYGKDAEKAVEEDAPEDQKVAEEAVPKEDAKEMVEETVLETAAKAVEEDAPEDQKVEEEAMPKEHAKIAVEETIHNDGAEKGIKEAVSQDQNAEETPLPGAVN
ncbi:unnamed protein product [Symbiodinium natans]|uniref:PDZ domain-containing protein n=1 Tax=Symbiodinium natans TaxID=878477 RepID=A0A812NXJ9_9DINO|nr:unnamed protein product [Symbiodinium natans]